MLVEEVAHVGASAIAVVGQPLHQDRGATGPVALIDGTLYRLSRVTRPAPAFDRTLDALLRHREVAGLLDRGGERVVGVGIAPALACSDRDRPRQLGELLPAARVGDRLLVLDRGPFGVPGHDLGCYEPRRRRPRASPQTRKVPFSCRGSPSISMRPPCRRSHTRSVWTALSFSPPVSG